MENWLTYVAVIICIAVTFTVLGYLAMDNSASNSGSKSTSITTNIDIKGIIYNLEVANTPELRSTGLMNRSYMDKDKGMLFVFEQSGFHGFWMKNTLIPLDLIWIDAEGKVVYIKENAQPCSNIVAAVCSSMIPTKSAKYVIELNAGQVAERSLKIGDALDINL